MGEMDPVAGASGVAVELLTLWLQPDRERATARIRTALGDPDGPDAASIIAAQCNLGEILIFELAKAQGAEDVRERAGEILQKLSRQFPE